MSMDVRRFDAVVVGSGLAGLTFALRAAEVGKVCVITKAELYETNTNYAQGGIAAAVGETDSWQLHEEDTLIAGGGLNDREAVRFLVQRAPDAIDWLISIGARFDGDTGPGHARLLELGREGGHSRNRIVHHADKTGWEIERAVIEAVRRHENIKILENSFVTQLVMHEGRCAGVVAQVADAGERAYLGRCTMLATGGAGRLYQHTTNPRIATADGVALAARAGAEIRHMEFMQFHPTTLYHPQMRSFLISEAARGAGGILRNHLGTRFMYDYDERLELAPRDIVSRAIDAEMKKLDTWCVYLDLTHLAPDDIGVHFPTIDERLRTIGIQMFKNWIPVVPAQHYSCGGVRTDLAGQTSIAGLYAAGEVACTGVHGANRLASNSLLEALVFAVSAAEHFAQEKPQPTLPEKPAVQAIHCITESDAVHIRHALQRLMTEHVGIVRNDRGLLDARDKLRALRQEYDARPAAPYFQYSAEADNMLEAARFVVEGAIARRENVGVHYNEDLVKVGSVHPPTKAAVQPKPAL